jgi:tetratricopeptide (TPR) repeat protein
MPVEVPEALRAVVLKAMAREREGRYRGVGELVADLDAYVGGFATSAEGAGVMRRVRLWVGRNRVVVGAAALFVVMGVVFTTKVIAEGRRASAALRELKESAPVFAARAEDELNAGDFESAERSARGAVRLDETRWEGYVVLGKVLQVSEKWEEAVAVFEKAGALGGETGELVKLTQRLVAKRKAKKEDEARGELFQALRDGGRQMESVGYAKVLGEEFWRKHGEKLSEKAQKQAEDMAEAERMKRKDPTVIGELIKRLEAKMLAVPGTEILLSKTEFTVGEWKLYLRAEGLPEWRQTSPQELMQTDDHPVVGVSWNDVMTFCEWLSKVSGKKWRLPSGQEWESAVGNMKYPWGDYFPPKADDGNFNFSDDGRGDPEKVGFDGVKGTAPVGSFKPNEFGCFDLGGNAYEMTIEGVDKNRPTFGPQVRGGSWRTGRQNEVLRSHRYGFEHGDPRRVSYGFRISVSTSH